MPALVTPFRAADGALDLAALALLAERAALRGAGGVVVCGSTGEAAALSPAEQAQAIAGAVEGVAGRVPVIAGVGAPCTEAAVKLALQAERCGATALLAAPPPYVRPSQAGIAAHLRAIAAASGLPVILYDVPGRSAVACEDATVARLFEEGAIQALKDATADLARPARLRRLCGAELLQFCGDDASVAAHQAMGGAGCISVTANLLPGLCRALFDAGREGEAGRLAELRDTLAPLSEALFLESNPVPVKAALGLLGLCDATPRLPLLRATAATQAALAALLPELAAREESLARWPLPRAALTPVARH